MALSGVGVTLILAAAVVMAHGWGVPSAPRWDLEAYFLERQAAPSFIDALSRLDFAIERRYSKGDEAEYRPLSYLVMAAEYAWFGLDVRRWAVFSLAAHWIVALCLFWTVRIWQRPAASLLIATCFAVAPSAGELVAARYNSGYQAACILLLLAIARGWRLMQRPATRLRDWIPCAAYMTVAGFFFEAMVALSLAAVPFLWFAARQRRAPLGVPLLLMVPFLLYGSAYHARMGRAGRLLFVADLPGQSLLGGESLTSLPWRAATSFVLWPARIALPALGPGEPPENAAGAALAANLILVLAGLWLLYRGGRTAWRSGESGTAATIGTMIAAFVVFMRFGRGAPALTFPYPHTLLCVLLFGITIVFERMAPAMRRAAAVAGAAFIALSLGVSAKRARVEGASGAESTRFLAALQRFVETHEGRPEFSFTVDVNPDDTIDREHWTFDGYPDREAASVSFKLSELFPGAAKQPEAASYRLSWSDGTLDVQPRGSTGRDNGDVKSSKRD